MSGSAVLAPTHTVCVLPDRICFEAVADEPLLKAAERAGLPMLSSCRNGTCRTCMHHMTAGLVRYRIAWPGLSADEKADGWILPCVAYPASDITLQAQRQGL